MSVNLGDNFTYGKIVLDIMGSCWGKQQQRGNF